MNTIVHLYRLSATNITCSVVKKASLYQFLMNWIKQFRLCFKYQITFCEYSSIFYAPTKHAKVQEQLSANHMIRLTLLKVTVESCSVNFNDMIHIINLCCIWIWWNSLGVVSNAKSLFVSIVQYLMHQLSTLKYRSDFHQPIWYNWK